MDMRKTFVLLALVGCTGDVGGGGDDGGGDDMPPMCEATRSYTNFGGAALEGDRAAIEAGSDRLRLKPFTALATEYAKALGLATFDTRAYAATFGRPPARWYAEPAASANTIYAAFALAFEACTQAMATDPLYADAPTENSAGLVCRDHARRAWHREASDEEVAACVNFTVNQTNTADAPRKRWAYSCAAVLGASGFLAY
jgi:hypothetical protein